MKKSIGFVMLMVVLLLAGCRPSVGQSKDQFCSDFKELGAAIQNAKSLNENSTVEQTKDARDQISKAWDKVTKSAAQLKDVQLEAMQNAFNALKKSIDDIPNEATLGQTSTVIQASVNGLETAYTAINTTVCTAR